MNFVKMDFFTSIFPMVSQGDGSLTGDVVFKCVAMSLVMGVLISALYLYTHKKTGYAQGYVTTTALLPAIVTIVLLLVGNNYAIGLSMAGIFALVRFRSVAGDPNDICYIFFSIAVGVALGLGYVGYAIVFYVLLGLAIFVMHITNYGQSAPKHMTLKITIPENLNYNGVFDETLRRYTTYYRLNRVKTVDFGSLFDLVFSITIRETADTKEFIDKIRAINGNLNVTLVLSRNDDSIYS